MSSNKRKQALQKLAHASTRASDTGPRAAADDTDDAAPPPASLRARRLSLAGLVAGFTLLSFTIAILYAAPETAARIGQGGLQWLRLLSLVLVLGGWWIGRRPGAPDHRRR